MTLNCLIQLNLTPMKLLKFSTGNAKLSKRLIFSIPSGYTCPGAGVCKTFADRVTGEIRDLPQLNGTIADEFRCFSAMAETRPNVRDARWYNWDLLKETMYSTEDQLGALTALIDLSLCTQPTLDLCRIHEAGDFWTELYMKAWFGAARNHPDCKFYAFTKSLNMWLNLKNEIPDNVYLTASVGGTLDAMIPGNLDTFKRIAYVVYTEQQAAEQGLEIDHDDSHCFGDKPFALLVHGSQRAGSDASKAISKRKKEGAWVGYHKNKVAV
jgi:hypothetical protein